MTESLKSNPESQVRVCIIGAGAAGYTAAIYAARANLSPLLLTGTQPGGQLTITTDVENFPGFAAPIQGPWLMAQMRDQAAAMGTAIVQDTVMAVDLSQRPFRLQLDSGAVIIAESLIICTGAQARWLGVKGEAAYQGMGVSACATCDGSFFRNQQVAVIGGGNTAVEEALYLTNHASKVTLIHRRDSLRAEKVMQDRLFTHPKVEVLWNTVVAEISGDARGVTALQLQSTAGGQQTTLPIDGVFVAIGHTPATQLFVGQMPMDAGGYLKHHADSSKTDVAGVFVAGDVCDPHYRQAVTAAGMGCMAALDAERFLNA